MNLRDAWHALMGGLDQDTRLIQLRLGRDPAGRHGRLHPLLAERIDVQEAIGPRWQSQAGTAVVPSACMRLVVHALSEDARLDLAGLACQPAEVVLHTPRGPRHWHGHVHRADRLGSDGGLTRYRLTVLPWLAFAAHARSDRTFKNLSVPQVLDAVLVQHRSRGALAGSWRFELADAAAYPMRSDCSQYQESDLDFVQRLMLQAGLFCWLEHGADGPEGGPGLVIADHNGALRVGEPQRIRYTQSHAALEDDSLTHWRRSVHARAGSLSLSSPDRRASGPRTVTQRAAPDTGVASHPGLGHSDLPGIYAYPSLAAGEQIALRQMQAIDARRESFTAVGTMRSLAPGRIFTLADHPRHRGDDLDRDQFVVLAAHHRARSNLPSELQAAIDARLGSLWAPRGPRPRPNDSLEPVYSCRVHLQRACVPVRVAVLDDRGEPDPRLHTGRGAAGVQTAMTVTAGPPLDPDRDHQVRVRHHWQRGTRASHPLPAAGADHAPAGDACASVMPVAESIAGGNWGSHFMKRAHQEVVVARLHGQVDRGVVLGSVYNGRGRDNEAGNEVLAGAAGATGHSPPWFPGQATRGPWPGHRHGAVLTGFKTQSLSPGPVDGAGGSTVVFSDSPEESRIELATATAATRLQLGDLGHLDGNEMLERRGSGLSLETSAWGALRAGAGLLLSAHDKPGSLAGGQQLDCTESLQALAWAADRLHGFAESAQKQNATLANDPDTVGAEPSEWRRQLPAEQACRNLSASLAGTDARGTGEQAAGVPIGGGGGTVASWTRPDLVVAAPGGIGAFTPGPALLCSGEALSVVAADVQHLAQGDHVTAVAQGLAFYALGKAAEGGQGSAELGIRLHAARGGVRCESQSGAMRMTADAGLSLGSAAGAVHLGAPRHLLLTAAGAALQIDPSGITLKGPGTVEFKASMKEFSGPATASTDLNLARPTTLGICRYRMAGPLQGIDPE